MFKHAGVPVDFDLHYLSEVSFGQSETVEEVVAAVRKTGVCLKGHFSVPGMERFSFSSITELKCSSTLDKNMTIHCTNTVH